MAEYESIHGTRVKYLSSDPTLDSSTEGQVWYNSTTGTNKVLSQIKAWSSGGNLGTSRRYISGCGTQASIVAFGGFKPGAGNETELYNGFSWSEVNNLGTAAYSKGAAGTQTAALAFGGSPAVCESWDGSNWTSSPAMNNGQRNFGSCGIQTAALAFGGRPEPSVIAKTEEWNGTAWSESNDLNNGVRNNMGSGTQTAALNSGGYSDPNGAMSAVTEEYNGTSWTTSPGSMNEARMASATNTGGIQTSALVYGGNPPASAATEQYDGISWVNTTSMSTARGQTGGGGTATAAIVYGGTPPNSGGTAATEEYNSNINAITQSAWSSGGSASSSARNRALGGTQTAAFMSGGYNGANSQTRATEEYNGSSWTSGGDLSPQGNPDGGTYSGAACGTQTAGLFSGGSSQGSTDYYFNVSYEYDGSSWGSPATWTAPGLNGIQLFGTQTAAVNAGGSRPGQPLDRNYEYDGSSWTTGTTLPEGKRSGGQSGILTAGVIFGGSNPGLSPSSPSSTFHYDGTNWTAGGTMNFGSNGGQSATASSTDTISYQGSDGSSDTGRSQLYNGTAWAIDATAATVTSSLRSGAGTSGAALSAGGSPNAVQEYEGGTEVVTASTLTTS